MKQIIFAVVPLIFCVGAATAELDRVKQKMVKPPNLPIHSQIAKGPAKIVEVTLVAEEKLVELAAGEPKIWAMTYNGSIPAPIIVVHQNDFVELTLVNPTTNSLAHNIDFHAATGAGGGAELTMVAPGQKAVIRFRATVSGVFVYHCAPGGLMVPWHVVSGMNGAIMVLPRGGLKDAEGRPVKYDRAYYIGEQDFYQPKDSEGNYRSYPSPMAGFADTLAVMKTLTPSHIVFNGSIGALTGENALIAKQGERVLFVHHQANRDSRPHLIGGHADLVWPAGSFNEKPQRGVQTWFIPGGSGTAMLYTFRQPGTYAYLNHNLIEAFALGAVAQIKVSGKWNNDLMMTVQAPSPIK